MKIYCHAVGDGDGGKEAKKRWEKDKIIREV
jgi:hypothetical protein